MDLSFTPEELAFRQEVRAFIDDNYPKAMRGKQDAGEELTKDEILSWHKILARKGWSAPHWPKEYGGPGWGPVYRHIFAEEMAQAEVAPIIPFGTVMMAAVVMTFGTDEQKKKWLPPTLAGDIWWCQGYSEPGSGSDLASLKTRAVRDGDHYVVNGQKTWTTMAQHADWGFFLVRTDPNAAKPQEGISFLLIDMTTPGITIRPIVTIDGGREVNEVFLEDVRVPVANRVYEENKGWTCAKFLLAHERTNTAGVARSKRAIERLKTIARIEEKDGRPLIEDPFFARKIAELELDLLALEYTELRVLSSENAGRGPGPESSVLKIKGTEIQQRLTELTVEAVGPYAEPYFRGFGPDGDNALDIGPDYAHRAAPSYFNMRKTSIYGGSNEIQRNIIAKAVLQL
jgi:alkylation response protein AidB-like acyl-CoA dehydrogenase